MKFNNHNLNISKKAKIGNNVKIGDNTIIYDNVTIGDNTIIANDCVLGEPLSTYYNDPNYENRGLVIGNNSLIRSHCIFYSGSVFGDNLNCGHRVTVREGVVAGQYLSIGTLSDLQGHCKIGDYCRFHSNVHIGQSSEIGSFVFIYPYVVLTNDPHPPSNICDGPVIGDYTQIAVHSVLLPGVKIGTNCLVGANSTVAKNFGDNVVIVGTPAKELCDIGSIPSRENPEKSHYPWMLNFERGMPWEGIGYQTWLKEQR